jgi:hypothetical protein
MPMFLILSSGVRRGMFKIPRQKAKGKNQKAKGRWAVPALKTFAFCLLPFAF